jgi:hypothetical protein
MPVKNFTTTPFSIFILLHKPSARVKIKISSAEFTRSFFPIQFGFIDQRRWDNLSRRFAIHSVFKTIFIL